MKWVNCNENKNIAVDAIVRRIGYTYTMTAGTFNDRLKTRLINALDYEWLDESPSPSIEELAQKLREANPYKASSAFHEEAWDQCVDEMIKLSKELK